ncbi:MAG: VOC family protein [Anaerolineales bacterium]|nr:VOC family protein [Anaerolineales bacterium]
MQIAQLDHLVLTVQDIEETCRFYEDALGVDDHRRVDGVGQQNHGERTEDDAQSSRVVLRRRTAHEYHQSPGGIGLCTT